MSAGSSWTERNVLPSGTSLKVANEAATVNVSGYTTQRFQRPYGQQDQIVDLDQRHQRLACLHPAARASASLQNHVSPYSGRMMVAA